MRWSLEEFEKLSEAGILTEQDRIELIGGELIPMSPKGNRHELIRDELVNWLFRRLPADLRLSSELGWRPNEQAYLEPDVLIGALAHPGPTMPPSLVRLLIEIAHTSLAYDAGLKADIYARLGVREYWVVNAITLETTVHREPTPDGYASRRTASPDDVLMPHLVPELALRLKELPLG